MYDGYLSLGGREILNRARAATYLQRFLPQVDVVCADEELAGALGHSGYTSPDLDGAPWYKAGRVASGRFLGVFPGKVEGAEGSTRQVTVTELSGNGAILTSPRHGSKEMRYVGTAFALDEEAMTEGMAWLKEVLSNDGCSDTDLGCTGRDAVMFAALPKDAVAAYGLRRNFFRVEATEGPLPTKKFSVKGFVMWQIEFTLTAGIPWAFTSPHDVATLNMDDGSWNFQDPAGENCGAALNAYDEFIDDPYYTAISRPPRPPVILPPNILDINSWRRRTAPIPVSQTQRWGRVAPVVRIATENAVQFLRIRFYRKDVVHSCDYDGEFLVSYIPATAVLTLDSVRREASVTLSDGRVVPAGNLLFGSDGTPFTWPTLGCQRDYWVAVDLMPSQPGVVVMLETSVRD